MVRVSTFFRCCVAVVLSGALGQAAAASLSTETLSTADGPRQFLLVRPDGHFPGPRPLVLLLHGHGGHAAQLLGQERGAAPLAVWLRIADREGWMLAALQGRATGDGQPGWNDCRRDATGNPSVDDVAFAATVVQRLVGAGEVDPARVFAMGMSNGAMMAIRLAQELEPPLAGFAAVSGLAAADSLCRLPRHPVPAMVVMGTDDPIVPMAGGQVRFGRSLRGSVLSAVQTVDFWRQVNQAQALFHRSVVPPSEPGSSIERMAFGPESGSAARVLFLRVQGGGHVEPSISQRIGRWYERVVGAQNHDVEIAEEAWRFFSASPQAH